MRYRTILQLVLAVVVGLAVHSGTIGADSPLTALVVPTILGFAVGLLLWHGLLGVHRYRVGQASSPKWLPPVGVEAMLIIAIVGFLFTGLSSTAPVVAGGVAVGVLSVLTRKAASTRTSR